ncbi:hypothetical protein TNCV_4888701 [Trichonephila clavipes]|nr:hypothetical protein TNCV_4888701 [Trichonephila clavipes]
MPALIRYLDHWATAPPVCFGMINRSHSKSSRWRSVVFWRTGYQIRYLPRHLTEVHSPSPIALALPESVTSIEFSLSREWPDLSEKGCNCLWKSNRAAM